MTFVKRIDKHPAVVSGDDSNVALPCPSCGEQIQHYVNEELTPEKKLRDGFTCSNSLFHNIGADSIGPEDYDLTCCDHKIKEGT